METTVTAAPGRYEIAVDGTAVGRLLYLDDGDRRLFHHTEVDEGYAGQGLAAALVGQALAETAEAGRRIVPVCPYVARYLTRHDDVAGAVDPVTDADRARTERARHS